MTENKERRRARRQQRGLLRAEEILHTAGALFAEVGYDKTTTNMIAEQAGLSPGSLYQFFANKEAVAQAYVAHAVAHLHQVYDAILAPAVISLPFAAFNDTFIDALITFNKAYPGYFALSLTSTISVPLAIAITDVQGGVQDRLRAVFTARAPQSTPEQRHLWGLVAYRIFIALLPLVLESDAERQQTIVRELKAVLYRYLAPMLGAPGDSDTAVSESSGY